MQRCKTNVNKNQITLQILTAIHDQGACYYMHEALQCTMFILWQKIILTCASLFNYTYLNHQVL